MHRILTATLILTLAVLGAAAEATVLVPVDLEELSREARTIARGRVVAVDAQWTDNRRAIETIVTLDAEEYLKGRLGDTVQFRVPGGSLGRFRNIVVGAPEFAVGQRVIVFLGVRGPSIPHVLGLSQGLFRLAPAPGGAWVVTPSRTLATMAGPDAQGRVPRGPVPLVDFERQVRSLAGGGL